MHAMCGAGSHVTRVCEMGLRVAALGSYKYPARLTSGGVWISDGTQRAPCRADGLRVLVYADEHHGMSLRGDERLFAARASKHCTQPAGKQWNSLRRSGPNPTPKTADECVMQAAVVQATPTQVSPFWTVTRFNLQPLLVGASNVPSLSSAHRLYRLRNPGPVLQAQAIRQAVVCVIWWRGAPQHHFCPHRSAACQLARFRGAFDLSEQSCRGFGCAQSLRGFRWPWCSNASGAA